MGPARVDTESLWCVSRGTMRFLLIPAAATCLLLGSRSSAESQKPPKSVELSGAPKCANCGLRLQEIAVLGNVANGPGRLEVGAYAYDPTRKLLYVRGGSRTEVNAYDVNGTLKFTVGFRDRRPPAGARDNSFAVGPGDSLWVLDPVQQRVTVYAAGTATAVRAFRVKTRIERILPVPDGGFIGVATAANSPDHMLVHLFSAEGKPGQPIGAAGMTGRPAVALSRKSGLAWIARTDSYTIDQWSIDGKQVASVHRVADWFSADAIAKARKEHRSPPTITDIYEDDGGSLWVSGQKPDPTYRRPAKGAAPASAEMLNVLEVLDVPSQRIEFADEVSLPLHRVNNEYFVEPSVHGIVGKWRVVKVAMVKR